MNELRLWVTGALVIGLTWDLALRVFADMVKSFPGQAANWLHNKRTFILKKV